MKRAIGIGFVAGIIAALIGLGCKAMFEPVCEPTNPRCYCMDPKLEINCSEPGGDNDGLPDPSVLPLPPFMAPHDGGADGDVGADR